MRILEDGPVLCPQVSGLILYLISYALIVNHYINNRWQIEAAVSFLSRSLKPAPVFPGCGCLKVNPRMHSAYPQKALQSSSLFHKCASCLESWRTRIVSGVFFGNILAVSGKMTAQEQMKKMLDELMGTQRDGE